MTQELEIENKVNIGFFGTSEFAVIVLEELKKKGILPSLIVTASDKPKGRGLKLTPPPVKIWAQENKVEFLQPQKLDHVFVDKLKAISYKMFIVAAYGKIIPKAILEIPKRGTLNVHPSLLPLYRGPSPVQYQILEGAQKVGVTIMLIDEEMDHGSILSQEVLSGITLSEVEGLPSASELAEKLAYEGGKLLAKTIPQWIEDPPAGGITPQEQDHDKATYTKLLTKKDGLINLDDDPEGNFRKIKAFDPWPGTYFFVIKNNKKIRIKITDAELRNRKLIIKKVVPEGKREINYTEFIQKKSAT